MRGSSRRAVRSALTDCACALLAGIDVDATFTGLRLSFRKLRGRSPLFIDLVPIIVMTVRRSAAPASTVETPHPPSSKQQHPLRRAAGPLRHL